MQNAQQPFSQVICNSLLEAARTAEDADTQEKRGGELSTTLSKNNGRVPKQPAAIPGAGTGLPPCRPAGLLPALPMDYPAGAVPQGYRSSTVVSGIPSQVLAPAEPPSAPPSDSEGEAAQPQRRQHAGRSRGVTDPILRAEATKEKNRRAQQRFRFKQKARMEALEVEVLRLRAMLTERGIDPGGGIEDVEPTPRLAQIQQQQQHEATHTAALAAASAALAAAGGHDTSAAPAAPSPHAEGSPSGLTVDQMYADMEAWLEECRAETRAAVVRFLQAWLSDMGYDARRLHYKAVQKRHASGNITDMELWVVTQAHASAVAATQGYETGDTPGVALVAPITACFHGATAGGASALQHWAIEHMAQR